MPLLALRRFQLLGHHPIAVAGGATGSSAIPAARPQERQLLTPRRCWTHNIASVKEQLSRLLDFDAAAESRAACGQRYLDGGISYLDFLRDIGKHFSVNQMVAKESVRARMEDREAGISYTEFSYMLLQAFDFYGAVPRRTTANCKSAAATNGATSPPALNSPARSSADSLWPDAAADHQRRRHEVRQDRRRRRLARSRRTSVYKFYQFWIHTDDRDVIRYLKYFTFLAPGRNCGAGKAARGKCRRARGAQGAGEGGDRFDSRPKTPRRKPCAPAKSCLAANWKASPRAPSTKSSAKCRRKEIEKSELDGAGVPLLELLVHAGLCPSKGQARKDIEGGGVNVNNMREASVQRAVTAADLLFGKHVLLRKGKKNYVVLTAK